MSEIISLSKSILNEQISGLSQIDTILDENIENIINCITKCTGHIIISGIGKSGIIAKKIASTMSSLGIPSFFLDPFNAGHGDLGSITKGDLLIIISKSGESEELLCIIDHCKTLKVNTISITRNSRSTIANITNFSIVLPSFTEAHEFGAPTTSTTQTLVIGDILAVCASRLRDFSKVDYAKIHPSGNLGMKITKVTEVMNIDVPLTGINSLISNALEKMTDNAHGFVCIVTDEKKLCGIVTDGDIRRYVLKHDKNIKTAHISEIYNCNPKVITENDYVINAFDILYANRVGSVIVVNSNNEPIGYISRTKFHISF